MWQRAKRQVAAAVVAAALVAGPAVGAAAGEFTFEDFTLRTSEDLLDICTVEPANESHNEAVAFCYGFFQGGTHYHRALTSGPKYAPIACPTEPMSVQQLVSVFVAYARANPQHLAEQPMDTAFRAMVAQWPCS
jgi:hypothetical protein